MIHWNILKLLIQDLPRISLILTIPTAIAQVLSHYQLYRRLLHSLITVFLASVSAYWLYSFLKSRYIICRDSTQVKAMKTKLHAKEDRSTNCGSFRPSDRKKNELFCNKLNYIFIHWTNIWIILSTCLHP